MKAIFSKCYDEWGNLKDNALNIAFNLGKKEGLRKGIKQGKADAIAELKSLLRCRNYRGCVAGKGCDGVCRIDSDICKSCENFGIPYSLLCGCEDT